MAVETGGRCPLSVFVLAPVGNRDHHGVLPPKLLPDRATDFITIQRRRPNVAEHDLRPLAQRNFHSLFSIVCDFHLIARCFQQHDQRRGSVDIVVYDQDAQPRLERAAERFCERGNQFRLLDYNGGNKGDRGNKGDILFY